MHILRRSCSKERGVRLKDDPRNELIPKLDEFTQRAEELKKEIDYLTNRAQLYKDEKLAKAWGDASRLVASLQDVSDTLKRANTDRIRTYVTEWYRFLHFDMHPVTEMAEEDITDPEFESITYNGNDTYEVVMRTLTHGRERIVIHSDGASWEEVYSADKL